MHNSITRLLVISLLLQGCIASRVTTVWKTDRPYLTRYNKIMVVGIIKEENDSIRSQVEKQMVEKLTDLGYYAVSSMQEFGRYGLSNIGEEGTYLKLCDNGIDAVLTLALIDHANRSFQARVNEKYTYAYYYNRIWNYRKIQNDTSKLSSHTNYRWESILFDLGALQPQCVLQMKQPLDLADGKNTAATLSEYITSKMIREKIIKKQQPLPVAPKPF
jgi:hypothetical protein